MTAAQPSAAADEPPPATGADHAARPTTTVSEIVVTAEKRGSTVQRTPMSITAVTGDQLLSRGISDIGGLVREVPGISVKSGGPGQTEFEMRGLASSGGAAPTVGFYLDETPLSPAAAALNGKVVIDPDLYDLARVEVLRGPQGTLYGSGSMGGTIRLITAQPDLERFGGSLELDGSATERGGPNGVANVALNLPILQDKVGLRVVATDKYISGWIDRVVENQMPLPTNTGCVPQAGWWGCARGDVLHAPVTARYKNVNWEHLQGERVELLIEPVEHLKITTTAFNQSIKQGGSNLFDGPPGYAGKPAHYQPGDIKEPFSDTVTLFSNVVSYDLPKIQITAATSYWRRVQKQVQDSAEQDQNIYSAYLPVFQTGFLTSPDLYNKERDTSNQLSEEVRVSSLGSDKLKWVAGVYYSQLTSNYNDYSAAPELCDLSVGGCAANPQGIDYISNNPYHITQSAIFGEASYTLPFDLTVTAGLRYFFFKNHIDYAQSGFYTQSGNTGVTSGSVTSANHGINPKLNIAYIPNKNLTIYGTISQGFRPGGVNLPLPVSGPNTCLPYLQAIGLQQAPLSYAPDSVWNYEFGEKAKLLDGRLTVNGDVYYIKWRNIQEPLTLACGYPYTNNAGDAASYGPEFEASYRITSALSIDVNATYTHATLTKAAPNTGLSTGMKIMSIPEYTENTALVYRRRISDNLDLTARINNSLVGPSEDAAFTRMTLRAYDIVNARLQLDRGPTAIALYINNLTDEHAKITASNMNESFNLPSLTRFSTNQPRTIGVDVRTKF